MNEYKKLTVNSEVDKIWESIIGTDLLRNEERMYVEKRGGYSRVSNK